MRLSQYYPCLILSTELLCPRRKQPNDNQAAPINLNFENDKHAHYTKHIQVMTEFLFSGCPWGPSWTLGLDCSAVQAAHGSPEAHTGDQHFYYHIHFWNHQDMH